MRRYAVPAVLVVWAIAVGITVVSAGDVTRTVDRTNKTTEHLRKELRALKREHAALEHWVVAELRPWVIAQAYQQASEEPPPLPPVPSVAPSPTVAPRPSQSPTPASESPSVVCLSLVCLSPTPTGSGVIP